MYIHPDIWNMSAFGVSAGNSICFAEDEKNPARKKVVLYGDCIGRDGFGTVMAVSEDLSFVRSFGSEEEARVYLTAAGMEIKAVSPQPRVSPFNVIF